MVLEAAVKSEPSILHADVQSLQQPDGSFAGDAWGEIDTRCNLAGSPDIASPDSDNCPAACYTPLAHCIAFLTEFAAMQHTHTSEVVEFVSPTFCHPFSKLPPLLVAFADSPIVHSLAALY